VRLRYEGLETILAGIAGRYAVGDALSIADVFLHLQIDKSDEFGVPLAGFPTIDRIYATLSGLPAFADTKLPRP
jgi:glutathione S-transferase